MTEEKRTVGKLVQALAMKALSNVARGTEISVDGERMDAAKLGERADRQLVEAGVELTQELIARGAALVEKRVAGASAAGTASGASGPGARFSDPRSARRRRPRERSGGRG